VCRKKVCKTEENFLQESVEVQQGTMPVEGDYSLNDFAALAGVRLPDVPLNESQKTVNELDVGGAFKRGWDNHNNLGAVGVENPLKKLGQSQNLKIKLT